MLAKRALTVHARISYSHIVKALGFSALTGRNWAKKKIPAHANVFASRANFSAKGMSKRPEMNSHDEKSEKAKTLKGNQIMKNRNNPACNAVALRTGTFTTLLLALSFLALSPIAQAVVPPPDGGYPNFTTAEGTKALFSLITGSANTAVGWFSLFSDTAGSFNTATGAGALLFNTADSNTAFGTAALLFNTTGTDNTALGTAALVNNSNGEDNTAVGAFALNSNDTGNLNTANGFQALRDNTTGGNNTASGALALPNNTTGGGNTANGLEALRENTEGNFNTATGNQALLFNITGDNNTANGFEALANNTTGDGNTANGYQALQGNTGNFNTAIGAGAFLNSTAGSANTALGVLAGTGVSTADNVICIGATGQNVSNSTWINNIYGTTTLSGTTLPVLVSNTGQLGTMSSSRRFKKEIQPMNKASEGILALKPVTFHYKSDTANRPQFGLIAEEVAAVDPDLVVGDEKGEIYTVRYDAVNAMLLNEFLKEHKTVQELESTAAKQETTIAELRCTTAEQETAIEDLKSTGAQQQKSFQSQLAKQENQIEALRSGLEKVSAQLELSKSRPQTVLNNQ